jgi:hypothetical protein
VSLHLLLGLLVPGLDRDDGVLIAIDAASLSVLIAAEQLTLIVADGAHRHLSTPLADPSRSAS